MSSARATYTVLNEWTLSQAGWVDQYGVDILTQNVGASHVITLTVNGVIKDTFTAIPNAAELYWHDITPLVVVSGAVIRVTLQVTEVGNNLMYWEQQAALFATPPTYCSLAQGAKDAGAMGSTAYGCHLLFIPGTASPDWDVVAYGGTAAGGAAVVSSVFGRIGAVVAVTGDYTAAQVTNAVSTIGSYADPAWLTSLAWGKITGAPTVSGAANYIPVFTAASALGNSVIYQSGSNIGIGTTNPAYGFHQASPTYPTTLPSVTFHSPGPLCSFEASNYAELTVGWLNVNPYPMWLQARGSGNSAIPIILQPSGGNVGIGTTSAPNRLLEVGSGIPSSLPVGINLAVLNNIFAASTSGSGAGLSTTVFPGAGEVFAYNYTAAAFVPLHINASQILMGDASRGNASVAIGPAGIPASNAKLTLSGINAEMLTLQGFYGSSTSNNTQLTFHGSAAAADLWILGTDITASNGSQDFVFANSTASSERMRITSGGNIGINDANPTSRLACGTDLAPIKIATWDGGAASYGIGVASGQLTFGASINASSGVPQMLLTTAGYLGIGLAPTHQLQLSTDDAAKTATSTWTVASDARLKRNIHDFAGGLSVIEKLHLIEAEYNGLGGLPEGLRVTGFLADELRAIVPHAVGSTRGKLRDSDAEETDILDMNLHEVLMHLILAVQQLNQRTEKN
jgi:hypothetical protein